MDECDCIDSGSCHIEYDLFTGIEYCAGTCDAGLSCELAYAGSSAYCECGPSTIIDGNICLSGAQAIPPSGAGQLAFGDFQLDVTIGALTYDLTFWDAAPPLSILLHVGDCGLNGPVVASLDISGQGVVFLTSGQIASALAGSLYVTIHSGPLPIPELRGQVVFGGMPGCEECIDCQPNGQPDDWDIATGQSSDTNLDGIPDECPLPKSAGGGSGKDRSAAGSAQVIDQHQRQRTIMALGPQVRAPRMPQAPHDAPKNRYLSFVTPPQFPGQRSASGGGFTAVPVWAAIQVVFKPSCRVAWLTEPIHGPLIIIYPSSTAVSPIEESSADGMYSRLSDEPVYRIWNEGLIHISDPRIVPGGEYELRATIDGVNFSEPLIVHTVDTYGDVVGVFDGQRWTPPNGVVDHFDELAIQQFLDGVDSAPHYTWVELGPQQIDGEIDAADLSRLRDAINGATYPYDTQP